MVQKDYRLPRGSSLPCMCHTPRSYVPFVIKNLISAPRFCASPDLGDRKGLLEVIASFGMFGTVKAKLSMIDGEWA